MDIDLKTIRVGMALDQHELADKLGITQSAISKIELGKRNLTRRTQLQLRQIVLRLPMDKRPEGWESL